MQLLFDHKSGTLHKPSSELNNSNSVNPKHKITKVLLKEGQYLKATILSVGCFDPNDLYYYPQIKNKLELNFVPQEKYYQLKNNCVVQLNTQEINFPKECNYY